LSLLQTLDLGFNNNIRGGIPPGLNKLTQLQGLDLQDNQLAGSFPPELCELSFLRLLFLGFNQLDGNLPPCIGDLQETTVFSVCVPTYLFTVS
jgi:Leucine-rich repeat (LRR) protein